MRKHINICISVCRKSHHDLKKKNHPKIHLLNLLSFFVIFLFSTKRTRNMYHKNVCCNKRVLRIMRKFFTFFSVLYSGGCCFCNFLLFRVLLLIFSVLFFAFAFRLRDVESLTNSQNIKNMPLELFSILIILWLFRKIPENLLCCRFVPFGGRNGERGLDVCLFVCEQGFENIMLFHRICKKMT